MYMYLNTVYFSHDKSSVLPLLYPRGNLSRDTLPDTLLKEGLRVNSVLCYNTTSDSEIDTHLQHLSQQEVSNRSMDRIVKWMRYAAKFTHSQVFCFQSLSSCLQKYR